MAVSDVYAHGFDEENGKTIDADSCPECSGSLRTDGGEISCTECRLVINDYWFDHGHDAYPIEDDTDDPRRVGAPLTPARHVVADQPNREWALLDEPLASLAPPVATYEFVRDLAAAIPVRSDCPASRAIFPRCRDNERPASFRAYGRPITLVETLVRPFEPDNRQYEIEEEQIPVVGHFFP